MKRRALMWTTAMVAAGLSVAGASTVAAAQPTETCDRESYAWSGSAVLAPGASVATGVVVPVVLGSTVRVIGTSADGLDSAGYASALPISVGGVTAVPGSLVQGGDVVVHGNGGQVTVNGASLVVDRCALVAVAPPIELPSGQLPETGTGETNLLLAALGAVAIGLGFLLLRVGRRATAGVREPGSQPGVPRPAPH